MNIRLKCGCGARFQTSDELRGSIVRCPKCGKRLQVPSTMLATAEQPAAGAEATRSSPADDREEAASSTAWHSHAETPRAERRARSGGWKWALLVLVLLVPVAVVAVIFLLPYLQPKDPRELVARRYLDAIRREDWAEANRLSVLTTHPRLTAVEQVALEDRELPAVEGKFLGLAAFHADILKRYRYNADRKRFELTDTMGTGLDVLSKLEQVKKKVEDKIAADATDPKRKSKNIEEQTLDDVLSRFGAIADLANNAGGLLSSQNLGPTYEDLLKDSKADLSAAERALAEHYMQDPAKWDRLLGRPFFELPGGMDFTLEEVRIQAIIRTEGQSFGERGRTITIRMVRFTMGSIDTGWRVWDAQ